MSTGNKVGNMTKGDKKRVEVIEVRRYSEALKIELVKELDSGRLTVKEAMEYCDITWSRTISRWRRKYGKETKNTRIVRVIMKDEQARIRSLEKALADKELELLALRSLVQVYEEDYGESIKKKRTSEQSAKLEKLRIEAKLV